jgi:hypothetical protein
VGEAARRAAYEERRAAAIAPPPRRPAARPPPPPPAPPPPPPPDPEAEEVSRRIAYRREIYRIKVGIAPILFAERPALASCGRYGRVNYQDALDPRNGTIDLVKRPREVKGPDGIVRVEWRAGLAHVATCKNPHVCATCSNFLRIHRAEEVNAALKAHGIKRTLMLTLTTRHFAGDSPAWLFAQWRRTCKLAFSGREWKEVKQLIGFVGQIRAMEPTHGFKNGWHIHQHRVVFLEGEADDEMIADIEAWFHIRWCRHVAKTFGERYVPSAEHGVKVTRTPPGDYLCKLGLEIVDVGTKQPKQANGETRRTFFQIAADAASGDVPSMALVREYAAAVRNEKQIHWSPGLKAMFGIGDEDPEADTESADVEDAPKARDDEEDWRSFANEEGKVIVTLPREYVQNVWSRLYGMKTPFGVPTVPAVFEALEAHEDDATAEVAALEVLAQVEQHGIAMAEASAAAADEQLREWGRPVESARDAHRKACRHPETCRRCRRDRRDHEHECAEGMLRSLRSAGHEGASSRPSPPWRNDGRGSEGGLALGGPEWTLVTSTSKDTASRVAELIETVAMRGRLARQRERDG